MTSSTAVGSIRRLPGVFGGEAVGISSLMWRSTLGAAERLLTASHLYFRAGTRLTRQCFSNDGSSSSLEDATLLACLQQMVTQLRDTTKVGEKISIVRQYPQLFPLLHLYLDPRPFYITSKSLASGLRPRPPTASPAATKPPSQTLMLSLLEDLRQRRLTGNAAKAALTVLLEGHPQHEELILALLDRNLQVGLGPRLLSRALGAEAEGEGKDDDTAPANSCPAATGASLSESPTTIEAVPPPDARHITLQDPARRRPGSRAFPVTSQELPVALGLPLQHRSVKLAAVPGEHWLISRKLDGIRCLAHYHHGQLAMYTRAGKPLNHLSEIQQDLLALARRIQADHPAEMGQEFYIDGELCVLTEPEGTASEQQPGTHASMVDDFRAALSIVLARPTEASLEQHARRQRLLFYAFDLIPSSTAALPSTEILSNRLARLKGSLEGVQEAPSLRFIKLLPQHRTEDPFEFRQFLDEARTRRWEGLILRRDAPFKPKRRYHAITGSTVC